MPEGAPPADEEPDARYVDGDVLPAGLRAVRTPGPEPIHYCLLTDPAEDALICSDLLMYTDHLQFVPLRFHDDPDATRASVRGLLDLPFGLLLLDHGPPQRDPKPQIETGARRRWAVTGSNRRPPACKAGALPTELTAPGAVTVPPGRIIPTRC